MRLRKAWWLAAGLAVAFAMMVSCGGDDDEATADAPATVSVPATLEATATSAPGAATNIPAAPTNAPPSATTVTGITDDELVSIAEAIFPEFSEGIFVSCDGSSADACPVTPRLKARLADPDVILCRCQNSSRTREIEVLPDRLPDGGGTVRVTMYEGFTSYDLVVVNAGGQWLVDDQLCSGQPGTSIYDEFVLC